jgi:ribosomal RNA-processing protein 17
MERKKAVEDHVQAVDKILKEARHAGTEEVNDQESQDEEEWDGIHDEAQLQPVDLEEEYIDEDRYTTVTIESVSVDRDGLHKPEQAESDEEEEEDGDKTQASDEKRERPRKKKKKQFRYETKFERQLSERKRRAKSRR